MAEFALAAPADTALASLRAIARQDAAETRRQDVYAAMFAFAVACLERGLTQTAADTLAFLAQAPGLSARLRDEALETFADLESRICPRVILDARAFAEGMALRTMLEYLLDLSGLETT